MPRRADRCRLGFVVLMEREGSSRLDVVVVEEDGIGFSTLVCCRRRKEDFDEEG
jgi:hypothetical protein